MPVIAAKYLPGPSLFAQLANTFLVWLALDKFAAPAWACGVTWTLFGIVSVINTARLFMCEYVHPKDL